MMRQAENSVSLRSFTIHGSLITGIGYTNYRIVCELWHEILLIVKKEMFTRIARIECHETASFAAPEGNRISK
jgi:hypothetical protein